MHEYGFARKRRGYGEFDKKNTNARIPARPFMGPAIEGEFGRISEHLTKNCSLLKTTVTI
jgi:phage gpG-like protein